MTNNFPTDALNSSGSEDVLDPIYLPFSAATLAKHFAPVGVSVNTPEDYLRYYQESADRYRTFLLTDAGQKPLPLTSLRAPCQIEKDERFWTAACWLHIFYASNRVETLTRLMTDCFGSQPPVATLRTWEECFEGDLRLYFEAHLPSPVSYKRWLRENLQQRNLIPYVLRAASRAGNRDFEGATHVDALLLNASNGFALLVEAKVLSDVSNQVSFDVARNQLARNIDVMLEQNPLLEPPLRDRDPENVSADLKWSQFSRSKCEPLRSPAVRMHTPALAAIWKPQRSRLRVLQHELSVHTCSSRAIHSCPYCGIPVASIFVSTDREAGRNSSALRTAAPERMQGPWPERWSG